MCKTLDELKLSAQAAMERRGHRLGDWDDWEWSSIADCERCGMWVMVTPTPLPSEIDIGGPGVALSCPGGWACPGCGKLLRLTGADLYSAWFIIGTCLHCRETIEVNVDITSRPIEVPF